MALGSVSAASFFQKSQSSGIGALHKRNGKLERRSAYDFDPSQVIAEHFAQQQSRLRRNIHTIDSDDEWTAFKQTMSSCCGALVFFRRHGCPSCNYMAPKISDASNDFEIRLGKDAIFVEVDVVKCPRTSSNFRVTASAPAFSLLSHGVHKATFSGVSTQVFQDHVNELSVGVTTCPKCTGDMRSCFDVVEENFKAVVQNGCLLGDRHLCVLNWDGVSRRSFGDLVPTGDRIVPFDVNTCDEGVKKRLELLEDRLHGTPSFWQASAINQQRQLTKEFLALHTDDGFLPKLRSSAINWLKEQHGHPSLWSSDEYQTLTAISNAILARRATRTEYWLLKSLSTIQGRSSSHRRWSDELRSSLQTQLYDTWMSMRQCSEYCTNCELPCVLSSGHTGDHWCGDDDHTCHRYVMDFDSEGGQIPGVCCQLHAGHSGICRTRPALFDPGENCMCAVCLDPLPRPTDACSAKDTNRAVAFPCKHAFHARCAELCLERSDLCPLCRSPTHAFSFRGKLDFSMLGINETPALRRQYSSTRLQRLRRLPSSATRITPSRTSAWDLSGEIESGRLPRTSGRLLPALPPLEHLANSTLAAPQVPSHRSTNRSGRPAALPPLSGRSGTGANTQAP